jgi:hypothetical protein
MVVCHPNNQDFKVQGQTRATLATNAFINVGILRGTMNQARAALCAGYEYTEELSDDGSHARDEHVGTV